MMSNATDQDDFNARWLRECKEWQEIENELIEAGKSPTAHQVSLEQRKRMLARGERPLFPLPKRK